jgi:hypothetical protein
VPSSSGCRGHSLGRADSCTNVADVLGEVADDAWVGRTQWGDPGRPVPGDTKPGDTPPDAASTRSLSINRVGQEARGESAVPVVEGPWRCVCGGGVGAGEEGA